MKKLIKESGIRDINKLRREFDKVIIVTHQDSDGVFSGIAMKKYFENYGFKVVDV
jgi:single-stranded DNA-specific DHH superfamily exonuclease